MTYTVLTVRFNGDTPSGFSTTRRVSKDSLEFIEVDQAVMKWPKEIAGEAVTILRSEEV